MPPTPKLAVELVRDLQTGHDVAYSGQSRRSAILPQLRPQQQRSHGRLRTTVSGQQLASPRQYLPRIHDVQRIERLLDPAHDREPGAVLLLHEADLALADAVLAGAGAVH